MKSAFFAALIFFETFSIHSVAKASQNTNTIPTGKYEFDTNQIPILNFTYESRYYTYLTTYSNLWKTPRWRVSELQPSLPEPPLSVSSAVSVAKQYARGVFPADTRLILANVGIKYAMGDIWFYEVQIKPFVPLGNLLHPVYASTGDVEPFDIVVLMDGTVPDRKETEK